MAVKREYRCDICNGTIADYKAGIGLRWVLGETFRNVLISDAERHLCNGCCQALRHMFSDMDGGQGVAPDAEATP